MLCMPQESRSNCGSSRWLAAVSDVCRNFTRSARSGWKRYRGSRGLNALKLVSKDRQLLLLLLFLIESRKASHQCWP